LPYSEGYYPDASIPTMALENHNYGKLRDERSPLCDGRAGIVQARAF
jgi:hypothetical protein